MLYCLFCGGKLNFIDDDSRQEWYSENYCCNDCGLPHERLTVFQCQSSLVESDTLEIDLYEMEHLEGEVWKSQPVAVKVGERKCVWCGGQFFKKDCERVERSPYYQHDCGHFVNFERG